MQTFIDEPFLENAISNIYQPIKRQKLKTFTSMTNVKKVNVKDRVIAVKSQSELFGRVALIVAMMQSLIVTMMQSRHVDLKDVSLGP